MPSRKSLRRRLAERANSCFEAEANETGELLLEAALRIEVLEMRLGGSGIEPTSSPRPGRSEERPSSDETDTYAGHEVVITKPLRSTTSPTSESDESGSET